MKTRIVSEVKIPEGVVCEYKEGLIKCKKGDLELIRKLLMPGVKVEIESDKIKMICDKGNKKDRAIIGSNISHLKNLIAGLDKKYVYELEVAHVHFPMTVKVEGNKVIIENFLGEKERRTAEILENVEVEVKGNKVIVSGNDIESAGQTAANIEKSARVFDKDRRVFQDGIFITKKGGKIDE